MSSSTYYKLNTSNKMVFDIFKKLRTDNRLFDLELVADGQKFQAHTFLMCAFSPLLHKIVVGRDNHSNSVRLNDVTAFEMKSILKLVTEQRVEVPATDRIDNAIKIFGIDCTVTAMNEHTLVYLLVDDGNAFTKMKKSLWTQLHKPGVTLFSLCGKSIPAHFWVLYLYCRRYRNEQSILQNTVEVLPATVSYLALMEAIQLIYTGKLRSSVDAKQLEQTFAFFGIATSKDSVQINDLRLRSSPRDPNPYYESPYDLMPLDPVSEWDDAYKTSPAHHVQVGCGVRPLFYPGASYEIPCLAPNPAPQTIRFGDLCLDPRYVASNIAQNNDGSRTLPRNTPQATRLSANLRDKKFYPTIRLNGSASNVNENGPSNASDDEFCKFLTANLKKFSNF